MRNSFVNKVYKQVSVFDLDHFDQVTPTKFAPELMSKKKLVTIPVLAILRAR